MVKNAFLCSECQKPYLEKEDAINCEKKHEEKEREQQKIFEKNKKMVFSENVEVKEEDLENQFGGVKIHFKEKHDIIILMGNNGTGLRPYRCLLPHQVYVKDIREAFEEKHFEVICVVGVKSENVFPIAYKNVSGHQRWKCLEAKKNDVNITSGDEVQKDGE